MAAPPAPVRWLTPKATLDCLLLGDAQLSPFG